MLRTPLCDRFGIDVPVIQAGMGPWTSAALAAAVSNAGGLGSLGAATRSAAALASELARLRNATDRPFAVNHLLSNLNDAAFRETLRARPAVVSFALSDPGELVDRVHDIGALVMHQVTTVDEARRAADQGVDVVIAQGAEAGGFGGCVAALALIPQVVDAVRPIPVVAAGGIADGRGLAAALCLGAHGVNIGTRFLASTDAPLDAAWQAALLASRSEDAVKFDAWNAFFASMSGDYGTVPRALRSSFVARWLHRHDEAKAEEEALRHVLVDAIDRGTLYDLVPFAGQTVGMIHDVLPAATIVQRIVAEADEALAHVSGRLSHAT